MGQFEKPLTPRQKAVWRNVHSRYPGFTIDMSNFFWDLAGYGQMEVGAPEFARMLLAKWPDGIDLTDSAQQVTSSLTGQSSDEEKISKWARNVLMYHGLIESILDGQKLIPFDTGENWLTSDHVMELEENLHQLKNERDELLLKKSDSADSIDELSPKRKTSIYRVIFGIAKVKYYYGEAKGASAVKNIETALSQAGVPVGNDTIRSILEAAKTHVKGND